MPPVEPHGAYSTVTVVGDLAFGAGATPRERGVLTQVGMVGRDASIADGNRAAGQAATNAVMAIRQHVEPGRQLLRLVHMRVFIRAAEDVTELSQIADHASWAVRDLVWQESPPSRSAVGVSALPGGAIVEVELIAELT